MTCGIYQIVNKVNGKRYVGSAVNFASRWRVHKHQLRKGNHHSVALQRAWNSYGEDSFDFAIIEECDREKLIEREQIHLDMGYDYNCSPTASSSLGVVGREETKEKCRIAIKEKWSDPEYRDMMTRSRSGWTPDEDWIKSRARGETSGMFNPERVTLCHEEHGCITETIWWFGKTFNLNKAHLRAIVDAIHRVKRGRVKIITVTPEGAFRGNVHNHAKAVEKFKLDVIEGGKDSTP